MSSGWPIASASSLAGATRRLRFRLDRALEAAEVAALERTLATLRPGAIVRSEPDGGRYRVEGIAPDAALITELADWCASHGYSSHLDVVGAALPERRDKPSLKVSEYRP